MRLSADCRTIVYNKSVDDKSNKSKCDDWYRRFDVPARKIISAMHAGDAVGLPSLQTVDTVIET